MAVLDGLARHLHDQTLVTYAASGVLAGTWPVALETLPQKPDALVVLTIYGGPPADAKLGYDLPRVQARVRGGPDPRTSRVQCQAISDALHGLGPVTLPDGTHVISCLALQSSPQSMGVDSNNRHEHVVNFELEVRNVTGPRV